MGVPRILLDQVDKQVAQGERTVLQRHFEAEVGLLESVEPFVGLGGSALPYPLNGRSPARPQVKVSQRMATVAPAAAGNRTAPVLLFMETNR